MTLPDETSGAPDQRRPSSPGYALVQLALSQFAPRALGVIARLGIADQLGEGPRTAEALAAEAGVDAASLARVLRLLAGAGVFEDRGDDTFALTPMGEALRANVPGSVRALVLVFSSEGIDAAWRDLEGSVRTGEPAFRRVAPGARSPYETMSTRPEATALFDEAMGISAAWSAPAVAAAVDFSTCHRVVDVGGGNGALLVGLLKAFPRLRGVVFDQAHAIARARPRVDAAGLADRCDLVAGSFFDEVPRGADAYLLRHVLMDWDDERAAVILGKCRAAMAPGGRVLILERVYPARVERRAADLSAATHDVNMLLRTGGRLRTVEEFRRLLAAAGLRLSHVAPTRADVSVVQGETGVGR